MKRKNWEFKRKNVQMMENKTKTKEKSTGIEQRTVTTTTTPMMITTTLITRRPAVVLLKMVMVTSIIKMCLYPQYFVFHRLSLR
jgi:hypothetical protein